VREKRRVIRDTRYEARDKRGVQHTDKGGREGGVLLLIIVVIKSAYTRQTTNHKQNKQDRLNEIRIMVRIRFG
jgi:hypothetical protein